MPTDVYVVDLVFSNEYHPEAYHIVYGLKQKDIYWIDKTNNVRKMPWLYPKMKNYLKQYVTRGGCYVRVEY